jgi:hypothetical protein
MSFVPPVGPNSMGPDVAREQAREIADEASRYALRHPGDGDDEDRGDLAGGVLARVRRLLHHGRD